MSQLEGHSRLYCFTNFYLSSIQKGIQTAHVVGELMVKYDIVSPSKVDRRDFLYNWAANHKVIIVKDGGDNQNLLLIEKLFKKDGNPYPWTTFRESKESLNRVLTAVGIVLPDKFYERKKLPVDFTDWEMQVKKKLVEGTKLAI